MVNNHCFGRHACNQATPWLNGTRPHTKVECGGVIHQDLVGSRQGKILLGIRARSSCTQTLSSSSPKRDSAALKGSGGILHPSHQEDEKKKKSQKDGKPDRPTRPLTTTSGTYNMWQRETRTSIVPVLDVSPLVPTWSTELPEATKQFPDHSLGPNFLKHTFYQTVYPSTPDEDNPSLIIGVH